MEFLGIVKKSSADSPTRYTFGEENYPAAVKKLCSLCNVSTTGSLFEYDLFEVVTGGYRVVGQKMGGTSVVQHLLPSPVKETVEGTYTPYSVMRQH